jgi:hypothetical protein
VLGLALDDETKGDDMHKLKQMLAFAVLTTGVVLSLMLASSAGAATVTHEILSAGPPESFYACSFPLLASFSGTVQMTKIDSGDSVQLIFTPIGPQTITVTNPANGKSITGIGPNSPSGEILKFSETSFVDHLNGISLNFVLPGAGGVLQVIGNVNFADGTFSGRNTRGDTTAFCNYLAGP